MMLDHSLNIYLGRAAGGFEKRGGVPRTGGDRDAVSKECPKPPRRMIRGMPAPDGTNITDWGQNLPMMCREAFIRTQVSGAPFHMNGPGDRNESRRGFVDGVDTCS